jgi:hypothetical protein
MSIIVHGEDPVAYGHVTAQACALVLVSFITCADITGYSTVLRPLE